MSQKKGILPLVLEKNYIFVEDQNYTFELNKLSMECLQKLKEYVNHYHRLNKRLRERRLADKIRREHIPEIG